MSASKASYYGQSYFLDAVYPDGTRGVLQVFEVATYAVATDSDFWASGLRRAREAAARARDGWRDHYTRCYPDVRLEVRLGSGTRCDAVVNKGVYK